MLEIAKYSMVFLGVIMLAGGIFGHILAKSKVSLFSGAISCLLLAISYAIAQERLKLGLTVGLLIAIALDVVFIMRLVKSKKTMPAAPLLFLCAAETIFLLYVLVPGTPSANIP